MTENASLSPAAPVLQFHVRDVTGTQTATATVQRSAPISAVVSSVVSELSLPAGTPYGLRDDRTGEYLEDSRPIGEQIRTDAKLTVTPKAHLG